MYFIATINGYNLNCKFESRTQVWYLTGSYYTCTVLNYDAFCENKEVTAVSGTHLTGKTNDHVLQVDFLEQNSECVPSKLYLFFKNLEYFSLRASFVSELHENDLEGLTKLKMLDMYGNFIETVPANFFVPTPNLESVSFSTNRIKYFEARSVPILPKLTRYWLERNPCINFNAENPRDLRFVHALLKVDCQPKQKAENNYNVNNSIQNDLASSNATIIVNSCCANGNSSVETVVGTK